VQYRLSTLFLIFFMVAASLALFGTWGIYVAAVLSIAALCLNRAKILGFGIIWAVLVIFIGCICAGLLTPAKATSREAGIRARCLNNLKQISLALHNYHDTNKHFPPANTCDEDGKPLFSWRVDILPMLEHGSIYDSLNKDEPWNSPHNAKILDHKLPEFVCPRDTNKNDLSTSYIAIVGPGTAWREDGPVKLSDLPDRGSHTVMAVEVVNSGVHWAEPRDLTLDEALEGLKTGKGLRISSPHPDVINILFADGLVRTLPSKMPISVWQKLLAGDAIDLDYIRDSYDEFAPDMVDVSVYTPYPPPYEPGIWKIILGALVWILSIILFFHRAIKSRPKPVKIEIAQDAVG
jgi:hypothetical protein